MTGSEHVKNIIAQTKNFSFVNSTSNNEVFSYLYSLRDFLRAQEQEFYDKLGVYDIKGLNTLLDNISINYNLTALNAGGAAYRYVGNHYTFKDSSKKNTDLNDFVEENVFDLFTELLSNTDADRFVDYYMDQREVDAIYNGAMDALSEVFNGITIDGGFIKYIFSARGTRSKTKRYAKNKDTLADVQVKVITLNEAILKQQGEIRIENNRFIITGNPAKFTSTIDKEIKQFIRPELMRRLNKTFADKAPLELMSEQVMRDTVNDIIQNEFGVILDSTDLDASRSIAINASGGGISGYLGELQSRLYFKQLFKNVKDAEIIDAGAGYIKSMSGATQMDPADTIIKIANEIFNIQVKNYAKGGAEWSGSTKKLLSTGEEIRDTSSAESFVKDRLQVNNSNLLEYFGAVTWHNMNPDYSDNPLYWEYSEIYQSLTGIFNSLKESFDTFLPNIIRLIAIVGDLRDLQYENFYFQKGHMIPSSAIIDGIIQALQGAPSKKIYTSSYSMYPGPSHYTSEVPYLNNYANFAKETSIQWRVSINFNSVLSSIGL